MGEGLLRQRRNLIIVSVLLWMMKYGGVTFTKFSFVGFDIVLKNPHALILSIWITFAYFLYRYYQYFVDEGINKLNSVFDAAFEKKCEPIIRKIVEKEFPENTNQDYTYSVLKRNGWIFKCYCPINGFPMEFELPISRSQLWKGILSAVIDSIFRNSVVTDYLLPLFIACFVLYYCGTDDWYGSFLHLLLN